MMRKIIIMVLVMVRAHDDEKMIEGWNRFMYTRESWKREDFHHLYVIVMTMFVMMKRLHVV